VQRFRKVKCAKCIRIFTFVMICTFVIAQILLMVFCFFDKITPIAFYISINAFTGFIILGLNINQIAVYCKLNGQPYKSSRHFEKVRKVSIVCAVWTVAYIVKEIAVAEGSALINYKNRNVDLVTSCVLALTDFITIIVPYYCVVDSEFVSIISCRHLIAG